MEQAQIETVDLRDQALQVIKLFGVLILQPRDSLIKISEYSYERCQQLSKRSCSTRASFTESDQKLVHFHLEELLEHKCDEVQQPSGMDSFF